MNVILQMPDGSRRVIPEGSEFIFRPGEKVVGPALDELSEVQKQTGLPLGDIVARATKAFGIPPCAPCDKRRQILNKITELGVVETVKQLKETF